MMDRVREEERIALVVAVAPVVSCPPAPHTSGAFCVSWRKCRRDIRHVYGIRGQATGSVEFSLERCDHGTFEPTNCCSVGQTGTTRTLAPE